MKEQCPIVFKEEGRIISFNATHSLKAFFSMETTEDGIKTCAKEVHWMKVYSPIEVIFEGIGIYSKSLQFKKFFSILFCFDNI